MTVELEAKPLETSSLQPVIDYAQSVTQDLSQASQEAVENGIHSACLQGKVPKSQEAFSITRRDLIPILLF